MYFVSPNYLVNFRFSKLFNFEIWKTYVSNYGHYCYLSQTYNLNIGIWTFIVHYIF